MQRIIGTEVEYGISSPSDPTANPILTSTQAVLAYAAAAGLPRGKRTRWDYEVESPLRDARGFDLSRSSGPPPIVDADEVGAANMILTNGARLYVDHAHPEYSAPETTDPLDAVIWDKAGERVMEAAARHVASVPGAVKLQLYKNNVDGKGASYGAHENYLMRRSTPFSAVIQGLTPFLVSRQVVAGAGRVGIGPQGDEPGFQLSQRADYIEVEVGLETTLKRGIINTRDEPHADADKYRRLHVIIGDANLAETSTYLKLGTTALVLDLIEEGPEFGLELSDLTLARPVHAVHVISRDPTLRATVALADGRELTGLALQRIYLERVAKLVEARDPDPRATHILQTWAEVLDLLERDPMECAEILDWPAKLRILEGFRQRENLHWSAPRLQLIDLQYSDVRLDKGLYNRLVARGSMRRLVTEQQVLDAVENPPPDTRAYFRGECMRRFGSEIAAASWDSVIFDLGGESLVRIPTLEPLRGSKAHVGALLDSVDSAAELVEQLTT
ncbi:depupylase/deamidase Dop [uncultured Mycolicibacterium sp.]|uniref:depupylase/deamidase Dop n=1 Tax=uncultured Mycolicibacterium sp. TaxID=2320817 RepID=UPI00262FC89B|nr:depupylase/deamidase Dop [uncultured Mycolicibacterium sp.]